MKNGNKKRLVTAIAGLCLSSAALSTTVTIVGTVEILDIRDGYSFDSQTFDATMIAQIDVDNTYTPETNDCSHSGIGQVTKLFRGYDNDEATKAMYATLMSASISGVPVILEGDGDGAAETNCYLTAVRLFTQ